MFEITNKLTMANETIYTEIKHSIVLELKVEDEDNEKQI